VGREEVVQHVTRAFALILLVAGGPPAWASDALPTPTRTPDSGCVGDCDGSGEVTGHANRDTHTNANGSNAYADESPNERVHCHPVAGSDANPHRDDTCGQRRGRGLGNHS